MGKQSSAGEAHPGLLIMLRFAQAVGLCNFMLIAINDSQTNEANLIVHELTWKHGNGDFTSIFREHLASPPPTSAPPCPDLESRSSDPILF